MSTEQISLEDHKVRRNRAVILTVVIMLLVTLPVVVVGWGFASASTLHRFHGVCNDGVGQPYQDFIHHIRGLSETGDTKELGRVLAAADTNSLDIYSVWLYGDVDAYRTSIQKILK